MGEIAEALERARKAKKQTDDAADAEAVAARSSAPVSRERPAVARDWRARDEVPRPSVNRELSLDGVRLSKPVRKSTDASPGAPRERSEGAQAERSIVLSREKDEHWRARTPSRSFLKLRLPHS